MNLVLNLTRTALLVTAIICVASGAGAQNCEWFSPGNCDQNPLDHPSASVDPVEGNYTCDNFRFDVRFSPGSDWADWYCHYVMVSFGDGNSSSNGDCYGSFYHYYNEPGLYTGSYEIRYEAYFAPGPSVVCYGQCTGEFTVYVVGNEPPVCSFTITPNPVVVGESVRFDASASYDLDGSIHYYHYSFDPGPWGSDPIEDRTFEAPGSYPIWLDVGDDWHITCDAPVWETGISGCAQTLTVVGPPFSMTCPDDMSISGYSTIPSLSLVGFRITNQAEHPTAFDYYVTAEGPATLVDKGDSAALSGRTPLLDPGHTYYPPEAGLVIPKLREFAQQRITYHVFEVGEQMSFDTVTYFEGFEDDFVAGRSVPDMVDASLSSPFSLINDYCVSPRRLTIRDREVGHGGIGGGFPPNNDWAILDFACGGGTFVSFRFFPGGVIASGVLSFDVVGFAGDSNNLRKFVSSDGVNFTQVGDNSDAGGTYTFDLPTDEPEAFFRLQEFGNGVWVDNFQAVIEYESSGPDSAWLDSCTTVCTFEPPVPVFIHDFVAQTLDGGVGLSWEVLSDEAVKGFNVYASADKESYGELVNMEGLIPAHVNTYVHNDVIGGTNYYYRLSVSLEDGSEIISQQVTVHTKLNVLSLYQNHPNPFNPSTTISFVLPKREKANLSVYNIEGKLVTTLIDEPLDAGTREVTWDGKDARGNQVGTGIYFYRLTAGKQTLKKKMVLLK